MKKEMRIETTTAMMTKTSIRTYMTTSTMKIVKIKYDFEIIGFSLLSPTQLNQPTTMRISREFNIAKFHARNR
ncbi:hypothetical protein YC2023_081880 [Brassica napus]